MRVRIKKRSPHAAFAERFALGFVLFMAWSWIMATIGLISYHGYSYSLKSSHTLQAEESASSSSLHQTVSLPQRFLPGDKPLAVGVSPPHQQPQLLPYASPLLIFTCNRDAYLNTTLTDILRYIPRDCRMGCPIIISQDGSNPNVEAVVADFSRQFATIGIPVVHIHHRSSLRRGINSYQALAVHYGWALEQVFAGEAVAATTATTTTTDQANPWQQQQQPQATVHQRVIILEEDLHISPDFFSYFAALAPHLDNDPTLLAVSAFNDNGYWQKVSNTTRLLRSDFFPGLGWMMTRRLWQDELRRKWPAGYWDDWLRDPAQRAGRHIIRPEVSRTFHFGVKGGASGNQFGNLLGNVQLNMDPVDWTAIPPEILWSELQLPAYDAAYRDMILDAMHVSSLSQALQAVKTHNVRMEYKDLAHFKVLAKELKLMTDEKAGVPRTAYRGVVEMRPAGKFLLFLIPAVEQLKQQMTGTITTTTTNAQ